MRRFGEDVHAIFVSDVEKDFQVYKQIYVHLERDLSGLMGFC